MDPELRREIERIASEAGHRAGQAEAEKRWREYNEKQAPWLAGGAVGIFTVGFGSGYYLNSFLHGPR